MRGKMAANFPLLHITVFLTCHRLVSGASMAQTSPFSDLSVEEYRQVNEYLYSQEEFKLKEYGKAKVTDAFIWLVEAIRPPKTQVLAYFDHGGARPERAARVIMHRGDLEIPVIEEYCVSPIPNPTTHKPIKNPGWSDPIPFNSRSIIGAPEYIQYEAFIQRNLAGINDILSQMTAGWTYGSNCTSKCLMWLPGVPPYSEANHYKLTPYLVKDIEGGYLHPIGLQFVINLESLDENQWFIELVWFQGERFKDFDELRQAYPKMLTIKTIPEPDGLGTNNLRSSLNFRGEPRPTASQRGPRSYMPDGRRFSHSDRRIQWLGWEFEFSMLASSGIQLYNVKFLKERIAYELSIQEIGIFYSGGSPVPSHNTYFDSLTILGLMTSELFEGIDCPSHAQFFDVTHLMYSEPHVFKNAVCVFEWDRGIPLRRHYSSDHMGGYHYAQGMPDNVLVVRQVLTVYNYDYVIDFMFHQAGQVEGKVSLTGYLLNTYYTDDTMTKYGHTVNVPHSIGNIHHHIVHLKADLDIKGTSNRFATLDIKLEQIQDSLDTSKQLYNRYFERSIKSTEKEATYRYNFDTPKYLVMYNEYEKNQLGHSRGYRIVSDGFSKVLLPPDYRGFGVRSWAEYQLAVTKHKDHERCSSSPYATMEPYDPVMSFENFFKDDENIVDQDLVAWIAMGAHHIPHTEDVPIVTTPGVQLTWFLLPYNYFDEDPSLASRDNIKVKPTENGGKKWEYAGVKYDDSVSHPDQCPRPKDNVNHAQNLRDSYSLLTGLFALVILYIFRGI